MKRIWKLDIPVQGLPTDVDMPVRAKIVHVAQTKRRNNAVSVWFEWSSLTPTQSDDTIRETRRFVTVATGGVVPTVGTYIGTAVQPEDPANWATIPLVWHLYEIPFG